MSAAVLQRSPFSILATVLYVLSVIVSIGVTLKVVLVIFTEPGDTLRFLFGVLETRFLPTTMTTVLGCWSLGYLKLPSVWLRLFCVPMALWGVYALMQFLAQ